MRTHPGEFAGVGRQRNLLFHERQGVHRRVVVPEEERLRLLEGIAVADIAVEDDTRVAALETPDDKSIIILADIAESGVGNAAMVGHDERRLTARVVEMGRERGVDARIAYDGLVVVLR